MHILSEHNIIKRTRGIYTYNFKFRLQGVHSLYVDGR